MSEASQGKGPVIRVYNTMSRTKEEFVPRRAGEVSIYVCGVTPYDEAHLGHARPSVFFDVVRKFLRMIGLRVTLVQNFTDVDDKIIDRAKARGMDPLELARGYAESYLASMDRLGVERADHYPKVSEHIPEIVQMIEGLIERGAAYPSDGSVFFSVDAFPGYGKLSRQRKEELIAGARIEPGEGKRSPLDFALWKAAKEGEPAWESPWGPGRPGWHIECSAMSLKYLGSGFDIHGGGVDLVFPHHENEIAQSEAFTGEEPFVRYWLHNGLVTFGDEKMSKSLGNFVTVDQVLEEYDASLVRYAILQHHYRSPMEFCKERMESLRRGWLRLNRAAAELRALGEPLSLEEAEARGADPTFIALARTAEAKFVAALADDFNTPAALAALFELVRDARAQQRSKGGSSGVVAGLLGVLGTLQRLAGDVMGVLAGEAALEEARRSDGLVEALVELVLEVRAEARRERNFALADRLRDRLGELGIAVKDAPEGTSWSFKE